MTPIEKAREIFDRIEQLRVQRSSLQITHAHKIGEIDSQLNLNYAKLGGTLDAAVNIQKEAAQ